MRWSDLVEAARSARPLDHPLVAWFWPSAGTTWTAAKAAGSPQDGRVVSANLDVPGAYPASEAASTIGALPFLAKPVSRSLVELLSALRPTPSVRTALDTSASPPPPRLPYLPPYVPAFRSYAVARAVDAALYFVRILAPRQFEALRNYIDLIKTLPPDEQLLCLEEQWHEHTLSRGCLERHLANPYNVASLLGLPGDAGLPGLLHGLFKTRDSSAVPLSARHNTIAPFSQLPGGLDNFSDEMVERFCAGGFKFYYSETPTCTDEYMTANFPRFEPGFRKGNIFILVMSSAEIRRATPLIMGFRKKAAEWGGLFDVVANMELDRNATEHEKVNIFAHFDTFEIEFHLQTANNGSRGNGVLNHYQITVDNAAAAPQSGEKAIQIVSDVRVADSVAWRHFEEHMDMKVHARANGRLIAFTEDLATACLDQLWHIKALPLAALDPHILSVLELPELDGFKRPAEVLHDASMLVDVDLEFVASEMVRESAMPFSRPDRALQRAIYRSILPADEAVFERARQIEARERDGFRGVASEEERLRIREVNQAVWAEAKPVATWQSSLLAKAYEAIVGIYKVLKPEEFRKAREAGRVAAREEQTEVDAGGTKAPMRAVPGRVAARPEELRESGPPKKRRRKSEVEGPSIAGFEPDGDKLKCTVPECGKLIAFSSAVKHKAVHTGPQPYACPLRMRTQQSKNCTARFATADKLRQHKVDEHEAEADTPVSGGHAPAGRASGSGSALTAIAEVPEEEEGGVTGAVEQDLSPPSLDTPKRDGGQDLVQLSAISSAVHPAATLTECAGFNLCNPMQVDDSVSCVVVNEVGGLSEEESWTPPSTPPPRRVDLPIADSYKSPDPHTPSLAQEPPTFSPAEFPLALAELFDEADGGSRAKLGTATRSARQTADEVCRLLEAPAATPSFIGEEVFDKQMEDLTCPDHGEPPNALRRLLSPPPASAPISVDALEAPPSVEPHAATPAPSPSRAAATPVTDISTSPAAPGSASSSPRRSVARSAQPADFDYESWRHKDLSDNDWPLVLDYFGRLACSRGSSTGLRRLLERATPSIVDDIIEEWGDELANLADSTYGAGVVVDLIALANDGQIVDIVEKILTSFANLAYSTAGHHPCCELFLRASKQDQLRLCSTLESESAALAADRDGTYVAQLIVKVLSPEDVPNFYDSLTSRILRLSIHRYGNYFMQALLRSNRFYAAVRDELVANFLELAKNGVGSLVLQAGFEAFDYQPSLAAALPRHVVQLAIDRYGCRVVQKALLCVSDYDADVICRELLAEGRDIGSAFERCCDPNAGWVFVEACKRVRGHLVGRMLDIVAGAMRHFDRPGHSRSLKFVGLLKEQRRRLETKMRRQSESW